MAAVSASDVCRQRVFLRGIVQAVGFRPHVYNLARSLNLCGFVLNSSAGVIIEIEGSDLAIKRFLRDLTANPPPLARIEELTVTEADPRGDTGFSIHHSVAFADTFPNAAFTTGHCET